MFVALVVIMMIIGVTLMAISIALKIVQFVLWVFTKLLEFGIWCLGKDPVPLSPAEPGSWHQSHEILDLQPNEWRVLK